MKLADYYGEIYVTQNEKLGDGCHAYCMDGGITGRSDKGGDLACDVGLPSCHCCDYFVIEKCAVSLLEMTEIGITKKNMKNRYPYIPEDKRDEFFHEFVAKENILKMYGSMLVLCWLAHVCAAMPDNLQQRKYNFILVICGGAQEWDIKALEGIMTDLRPILKERIKSVASKFVAEVTVLNPEMLKARIKKRAVALSESRC